MLRFFRCKKNRPEGLFWIITHHCAAGCLDTASRAACRLIIDRQGDRREARCTEVVAQRTRVHAREGRGIGNALRRRIAILLVGDVADVGFVGAVAAVAADVAVGAAVRLVLRRCGMSLFGLHLVLQVGLFW